MTCARCGHALPVDARFCMACGAPADGARAGDDAGPAGLGMRAAADAITSRLGLERIEGFSLREFFSQVFSRHDPTEVERLLSAGSPDTTPPLDASMARMPTPWLFFRVLAGAVLTYFIFLYAWEQFANLNLVPGLIVTGSFAVPFAVLILFFELNTPRNVSLFRVVQLVVLGGAIALLVSLFLYRAAPTRGLFGALTAGLVEESGKLAALLAFGHVYAIARYRYALNGLLFGAAIGAGFAAFESAGYALRIGLLNTDAMLANINVRGLLSPFAHVAWSAIAAGAYWRRRPRHDGPIATLGDRGFLTIFAVPVVLHAIWDLPFELPLLGKYLLLGAVAWIVIISLVQGGLREIAQALPGSPSSHDTRNPP